MRKTILTLLLTAVLTLCVMPVAFVAAAPTPVPTATAGAVMKLNNPDVTFRKQPIISVSTRIRTFAKDELVTFIAFEGTEWAKVKDKNGVEGFCSKKYLQLISVPTPTPVPTATPTLIPSPTLAPATPTPVITATPKPVPTSKSELLSKLSTIPAWIYAELALAVAVGLAAYYYKKH